MKLQKYISSLLDVLIVFFLLAFFSSFGFQDGRSSGWYQQWFPNLNGSSITSMTFLDSLTGYAVTSTNSSVQAYIIKTTNGGDNWSIVNTYFPPASTVHFTKIQFADSNIGFASTNFNDFYKTTNAGLNWINLPNVICEADDIAVLNKDTILCVSSLGFCGGVFRTTNGGLSWQALGPTGGNGQPGSIYMFNKNIGFCLGGQMRKTTNGGVNWFAIPNETYASIQFLDSLTGWKCWDSIKKTTNGGLNWFTQRTPNNNFSPSQSLSVLNKDTVWMVGARNYSRAPIYKTVNGGTNWGFQVPDTTLQIYFYSYISFINNKVGWAYPVQTNYEIHTKVGGDSTYIMEIANNISTIPEVFILFQNYPNPFNNKSKIKYQILKSANIEIKIYDVRGSEISTVVNKKLNRGMYEIAFDGSNLSSGMYYYSLFADGERIDTKKLVLIK